MTMHVQSTPRLPAGGLTRERRVLGWRWSDSGSVTSALLRCKGEEWFLLRGRGAATAPAIVVEFFDKKAAGDSPIGRRAIDFVSIQCAADPEWFGWFQAPANGTHLRVRFINSGAPHPAELEMRAVAERDPKCHPSANVPRWSAYAPPFPIRRVLLPRELGGLRELITGQTVEAITRPRSLAELERQARGTALILPPEWIDPLKIRLPQLERLASAAWVIVDLETLARLVAISGATETQVATYAAPNEFMSARNEYADVATRGLALFDCVPFGSIEERGRFFIRVLRATRGWQKYADEAGFATVLSSQTPWEKRCNDVLSAARPVGGGELIGTDLPWLCTGKFGRPLAPHIAAHLLRMHLGGPIDPWAQYWTRWYEDHIVVRDITDLAKRYPLLRTARWRSADSAVATLGVTLDAGAVLSAEVSGRRSHLVIDTGRMDARDQHDGLAPEPIIIFLRQLAREAGAQTAWARKHLAETTVTWRFETAAGLRYATLFESARPLESNPPTRIAEIRTADIEQPVQRAADRDAPAPATRLTIPASAGLFGDRAFEQQQAIGDFLRRQLALARR